MVGTVSRAACQTALCHRQVPLDMLHEKLYQPSKTKHCPFCLTCLAYHCPTYLTNENNTSEINNTNINTTKINTTKINTTEINTWKSTIRKINPTIQYTINWRFNNHKNQPNNSIHNQCKLSWGHRHKRAVVALSRYTNNVLQSQISHLRRRLLLHARPSSLHLNSNVTASVFFRKPS